jgi:hypothetical protein
MFEREPTMSQGWLIENGSASIMSNLPYSKTIFDGG